MQDIRQTEGWEGYLSDKGWRVVSVRAADGIHNMKMFVIPLGIFGLSMMKLQRSEYDPDWDDLAVKKIKNKVVSSVIEPLRIQDKYGYLMAGYKQTKYPYLATSTYLIDLTLKIDELWKNLSTNAKRNIEKNKKTIIEECDPEEFFNLWKKNSKVWVMKKTELWSLLKRFKGKARLVVSRVGSDYHSGLLIIDSEDTTNYYQTWTSDYGRESGAHYKLIWSEMIRAKKAGKKWFDLEGVFDERWPQKRWLGFTEFKRRFGGTLKVFPGSFFRWF